MSDGRMQVLSFFCVISSPGGMSIEAPCAARGGSADTGRIAKAALSSEAIRSLYTMRHNA